MKEKEEEEASPFPEQRIQFRLLFCFVVVAEEAPVQSDGTQLARARACFQRARPNSYASPSHVRYVHAVGIRTRLIAKVGKGG